MIPTSDIFEIEGYRCYMGAIQGSPYDLRTNVILVDKFATYEAVRAAIKVANALKCTDVDCESYDEHTRFVKLCNVRLSDIENYVKVHKTKGGASNGWLEYND